MNIKIIETESGKLIAELSIKIGGLNYSPTEEEHFDEAWRAAVEDKIVDATNRQGYSFQLSRNE